MKLVTVEYSQYLLNNVSNYKNIIQNTPCEILTKITKVLIEYMRLISEKNNIKNKQYYIFIFERGIETLIHIFSMIFYYTKNLELSFYHTQKAYYFYIEFIEQISDDTITFLQLSSRDALMFVYKKTIFEINNDIKKKCISLTKDEQKIISYIDDNMSIYKKIVSFMLAHKDFKYENKLEYINICCDKIQDLTIILNRYTKKESIYLFINLLENKNLKSPIFICQFFKLLEEFIIKSKLQINKRANKEKNLINKIYDCSSNNYINEYGTSSLIEYIFTE
jgi:hypothetical protein